MTDAKQQRVIRMYRLIQYQLEDVQYSMINGYIDFSESPEDLKSIRVAIKLSKRLGTGYSGEAEVHKYMKKWPHDYKGLGFNRKISEEERADMNQWHISEERQEKRDLRNLLALMEKYGQRWMD